jgi:membrane protease YdiL (CAAX protease family)
MSIPDFFFNRAGRLRSFWRLLAFVVVYLCISYPVFLFAQIGLGLMLPRETYESVIGGSNWGFVLQSVMIFGTAAVAGWVCGRVIEDLPWRALGWAVHRGWGRDLLLGILLGGAGIVAAFAVGRVFGGYRVSLNSAALWPAILQTAAASGFVFLLGAAAEEMLFRGYPFQTLLRSWPLAAALLPTSVFFALAHLDNPSVAPGFTVLNTTLAGVWLAVAYWRTRSLWFPTGLHWGWNWAQGAFLGSPVSGITSLAPDPLLRFADEGPAWLGGGAYGIEGGAACTVALLLSTLFVWRTRLVTPTAELREYTDGEIPNPDAQGPPSVVPKPDARTRLHLVYLRPDGLLLTRKPYADWREIQDDHADYMTSLGPFDEDDLIEFLTNEYGADDAHWAFTRTQLRDFIASDATVLKS